MGGIRAGPQALHLAGPARAGSREALGLALDQCRRYLQEIARQALGPDLRVKGGASDLVQETFLEAQQIFERFKGRSAAQLHGGTSVPVRHPLTPPVLWSETKGTFTPQFVTQYY